MGFDVEILQTHCFIKSQDKDSALLWYNKEIYQVITVLFEL